MSPDQVKTPEVREPLRPAPPTGALAEPAAPEPARGLGRLPLIAFLTALGLLVVSVADALSRSTITESPLI
jgi:hypothetical protein